MVAEDVTLTPQVSDSDHRIGSIKLSPIIVEYGDYQCEHCRKFFYVIEKILADTSLSFTFVFRHFPLQKQHELAQLCAEAAEAAHHQNKFWEYHKKLYKNQPKIDRSTIYEWAEELQLDMEVFETQLKKHVFADKVSQHFTSGIKSGVNGTPTIFINGKRFNGEKSLENIKKVIGTAREYRLFEKDDAQS